MNKTRSIRPRLRSRGKSLEIRCRANTLPLKSLLYIIAYAIKYAVKPKNSNASLYSHRLASQMREISALSDTMKAQDVNPDIHSRNIKSAINTYVELFYAISKEEREEYINTFNKGRRTKVFPGRNLLLIPALMAELKQSKEEVSRDLYCFLYKMPFNVLRDSSKMALHVALLEQNMAIRAVSSDTVEKFSKSMSTLESRINEIKEGNISPHEDEDVKADFIEKAMEFSTDINIIDLISEKVGTESTMRTRMYRIMRRARY